MVPCPSVDSVVPKSYCIIEPIMFSCVVIMVTLRFPYIHGRPIGVGRPISVVDLHQIAYKSRCVILHFVYSQFQPYFKPHLIVSLYCSTTL